MSGTRADARKAQEALERAPLLVCEQQRRREVTQQALAEVYAGAGFLEADAFLDHLDDLGFGLVEQ